jgi:type II secretory pathway pseudopilin PulG
MRKKSGIGLIELLVAIPLLFILMFLGANRFNNARLAAHRAEVPSNVDGIRTAQIAYKAAWSQYIEVSSWTPSSNISKTQRSWSTGRGFDTLGWSPKGKVKGRYKVSSKSSTNFIVTGECDVDGDDDNASFTATKAIDTKMNTAPNVY